MRKRHLRASPVVVQTGEAGEVLLGDGGSRLGCYQTVGVGGVSYNKHLQRTSTRTHWKSCAGLVQRLIHYFGDKHKVHYSFNINVLFCILCEHILILFE